MRGINFYVNDLTSCGFDKSTKKKQTQNVESKIKSFAVEITNLSKSRAIVDYAEDLGLTVGSFYGSGYGDYLTFGVNSAYDVSYTERKPRNVEEISMKQAERRVEKMADKKEVLAINDFLRVGDKTYRELALGENSRKKQPKKQRKQKSKATISSYDFDLSISDHYYFNDDFIGMKNPNDVVCFNIL